MLLGDGLSSAVCAEAVWETAASELGEADAAVLRADGFAGFSAMSSEALRRMQGVVEDYRAWARPWGFAPEDLRLPVDVWGGAEDDLIDRDWAPELARRIPGARLRVCSGGHFMAHLHYREIFEALRSE